MLKALSTLTAAATLAIALSAAPTDAFAQRRGAVAAGIIGGVVAGAIIGRIIGGAIIGSTVAPRYYEPAPVYVAPRGPGPGCYYQRQRVWDEEEGVWRRSRVLVCP